jgi:hypothetical protein
MAMRSYRNSMGPLQIDLKLFKMAFVCKECPIVVIRRGGRRSDEEDMPRTNIYGSDKME